MTRLSRPSTIGTFALIVGFAAAACSSASSPTPSSAPATVAPVPASVAVSVGPSESTAPSESASSSEVAVLPSGPSAVPTSIDPCTLISADEAGTLAGATFGPGKESETSGHVRSCVYGAQTKTVFTVVVAIAPDEATAKAQEAAAQAQLSAAAAKDAGIAMAVTQVPNFAAGADAVLFGASKSIAGHTIGGRAIYVLRGTTFFGFSDLVLDGTIPSVDAVTQEAMTVLTRLP